MLDLPKFYPIVPNSDFGRLYIEQGVRFLQIRIKDKSQLDTEYELKDFLSFSKTYHCTVVINDYWELAIKYHAGWVHLGQEDLDDADINAIKTAGIKIGISTHDINECHRALSYNPDYIALGPVYFTKLKAMTFEPQGLDKITQWKQLIKNCPLVAIGGMTPERAVLAKNAGADSISVVTDITHAEYPIQRLKEWLAFNE